MVLENSGMYNYDNKSSEYFGYARKEMIPFIPPDCRRLLDVGCGTGSFGELLKKTHKLEVWGVEPNASAAEIAKDKLDHVANDLFSEDVDIPDSHFDAIIFNDSLEHFPDPAPPLLLCKNKLRDNGVVIASIPNVRYIENMYHVLVEMDWKYQKSGILDYTHLRFFTKKSIHRTFEELNFDVSSVVGINPHYWTGKKIFLLRLLFKKYVEDMKYLQYVVTARPRPENG